MAPKTQTKNKTFLFNHLIAFHSSCNAFHMNHLLGKQCTIDVNPASTHAHTHTICLQRNERYNVGSILNTQLYSNEMLRINHIEYIIFKTDISTGAANNEYNSNCIMLICVRACMMWEIGLAREKEKKNDQEAWNFRISSDLHLFLFSIYYFARPFLVFKSIENTRFGPID